MHIGHFTVSAVFRFILINFSRKIATNDTAGTFILKHRHRSIAPLLKNATRTEIMEAIETVLNGGIFLSLEAAATIRENKDAKIPVITRREKEVLLLVADGLTNNASAEKLFISNTTVDSHRNSLLAKFEVKNTANLIRLAAQYEFLK